MDTDLLSGKPLCLFTAEEYKLHVRALFFKRPPKKSAKKPLRPYAWKLTPKGNLSVKVNRTWISREDLDLISRESGKSANEVWLKVFATGTKKKPRKPPRLSTAADEEKLSKLVVVPTDQV